MRSDARPGARAGGRRAGSRAPAAATSSKASRHSKAAKASRTPGSAGTGGAAATGLGSAPARFAERARQVRMRPWRLLFGVLIVAAVVAGVWWLLVGSPCLRVTAVQVVGAAPDREVVIRQAVDGLEGKPLVEVDTEVLDHRITSTNLFAAVDVRRSWPDEVLVRVEERTPAAVSALAGGAFELVDREGVAYERVTVPPHGVPRVSLERPGDPASRATAAAVGLALPADLRSRIKDFSVDAGARATFTLQDVEVLWGDAADSAIKAAVLRPLLDKGGVARIDLTVATNPVTSDESSTSGSSKG